MEEIGRLVRQVNDVVESLRQTMDSISRSCMTARSGPCTGLKVLIGPYPHLLEGVQWEEEERAEKGGG